MKVLGGRGDFGIERYLVDAPLALFDDVAKSAREGELLIVIQMCSGKNQNASHLQQLTEFVRSRTANKRRLVRFDAGSYFLRNIIHGENH